MCHTLRSSTRRIRAGKFHSLVMGIVASISFFCVFKAYSIASPSIVSLFEYSYILWAMLAGYLLFDTIPVPRTFIGTALIIGAGFYIFFREKVFEH